MFGVRQSRHRDPRFVGAVEELVTEAERDRAGDVTAVEVEYRRERADRAADQVGGSPARRGVGPRGASSGERLDRPTRGFGLETSEGATRTQVAVRHDVEMTDV